MIIENWIQIIVDAVKNIWQGFIDFIPRLIGAIIIFLIGWIIAVVVAKIVTEILKRIKFNRIFEKGGWKTALEKAEIKVDAAGFIGAICKWVLMIVFLSAAIEVLGLVQFADLLNKVITYLPNVVVAAFIFVVALIIADILEKVVRAALEGAKVGYGHLAGVIVKWSIWIFALLTILMQLGIGKELILTLFTGLVGLIAISGGIAFGLGGKEIATEILQNLKKRIKEK